MVRALAPRIGVLIVRESLASFVRMTSSAPVAMPVPPLMIDALLPVFRRPLTVNVCPEARVRLLLPLMLKVVKVAVFWAVMLPVIFWCVAADKVAVPLLVAVPVSGEPVYCNART